MITIIEKRIDMNNNESMILKGIYQLTDGSFEWLTSYRSGQCKKLSTAMKKVGLK